MITYENGCEIANDIIHNGVCVSKGEDTARFVLVGVGSAVIKSAGCIVDIMLEKEDKSYTIDHSQKTCDSCSAEDKFTLTEEDLNNALIMKLLSDEGISRNVINNFMTNALECKDKNISYHIARLSYISELKHFIKEESFSK